MTCLIRNRPDPTSTSTKSSLSGENMRIGWSANAPAANNTNATTASRVIHEVAK